MRICLLTRALPYHQYGGLESHTLTLAKALQNRGHTITIVTSAQPDDVRVENFQPLPFEIISLPKTQPGKYTLSFFRESAKVILELDKKYNFDIVHSQGFAGFGYMFRKTKPLVVTIHGTLTSETMLFPQKFSLPNLWKYRKRLGVSPLYHQLLNRADAVLVDSHFSEQLLLRENKNIQQKLAVVYLGIDTDYFVPYDKREAKQQFGFSDEFLILALGRLTESKGFQILLDAVNRIKDIPYQVVIAGEGQYRGQLEKIAEQKKVSRVRFLGKVPESQLPKLYSSADIFVNPDLTAPAFGLVAAEALSCGTPVIASNTGALPEVVTPEVGICVPAGEPEKLAEAIKELYQDRTRRQQMSQEARNRVESLFTVDRLAEETEKVYQKLRC